MAPDDTIVTHKLQDLFDNFLIKTFEHNNTINYQWQLCYTAQCKIINTLILKRINRRISKEGITPKPSYVRTMQMRLANSNFYKKIRCITSTPVNATTHLFHCSKECPSPRVQKYKLSYIYYYRTNVSCLLFIYLSVHSFTI